MIKIGKLIVDQCEFGGIGTNVEIGEAQITNTRVALWDGILYPRMSTNQGPDTTREQWEAHLESQAAQAKHGLDEDR